MILGQSIFDAVMTRLKEEREETEPPVPDEDVHWKGVTGLNAGFVGATDSEIPSAAFARMDAAYFDFTTDPAETVPFGMSDLERLTPEQIAQDMSLSSADTPTELHAKRRDFARRNHPDLVPEEWRAKATLRMKIANLLIDEALREASNRKAG